MQINLDGYALLVLVFLLFFLETKSSIMSFKTLLIYILYRNEIGLVKVCVYCIN